MSYKIPSKLIAGFIFAIPNFGQKNIVNILPPQIQASKQNDPFHIVKLCRMEGCQEVAGKRTPYCKKHSGIRRCEHPICKKYAQGKCKIDIWNKKLKFAFIL